MPLSPRAVTKQPNTFRRLLRLGIYLSTTLLALAILSCLLRYTLVPILVYCRPNLDAYFFDLGVYGVYPQRHYRSFHLSSPSPRTPVWSAEVCERESAEGGLVLLDISGEVSHTGPAIFDLKGNLVWTDNTFGQRAMNLRWQKWKGEEYLTFWAGEFLGDFDYGKYYMLDRGFNLVKTVQAVGKGLHGDPHEFIITQDDTALIVVSPRTRDIDVGSTHHAGMRPDLLDAVLQEIDIDTGELLFEWRASQHFNDGEYLKYSYDPTPLHRPNIFERVFGVVQTDPIDYFHMNSVDKDSDGNYLVSIRKTHQVICVSGINGEILWGLGGRATDFTNVEAEDAIAFRWQHDARWIDEDQGLLSLFDNGMSKGLADNSDYSQGLIFQVEVANRTFQQVHSYNPLHPIRSISQGSLTYLPGSHRAQDLPNAGVVVAQQDQVFVGWGSALAYTLHDAQTEELLCETHFSPAAFFSWERVKSYRSVRAPRDFHFRPEKWDPSAVWDGGRIYVSWNGGVEVRSWLLQGRDAAGQWENVRIVVKEGFETAIALSSAERSSYCAYTIAALDADGNVMRHSGVVEPPPASIGMSLWMVLVAALATTGITAVLWAWRRGYHIEAPLRFADVVLSAAKRKARGYQKVESDAWIDSRA